MEADWFGVVRMACGKRKGQEKREQELLIDDAT